MKKKKDLNSKVTNMLHMEQKDYRYDIVGVLLHGENHIRGIAKELKINHMMIVRKIRELLDLNVVDFSAKGKNKSYFIKNSVEARNFILMFEQYSLINFLIKHPSIKWIVEKIQRDKRIKLALIFGSYAKNLEHKSSDLDLFFETSDSNLKKEYSLIDSKLSVKIGKLGKDNLSLEIIKNHIIIKGGEKYYEQIFK